MKIKAKDLAALLNGVVEGDPNVEIDRPSKIEEGTAGSISFLANSKYEPYAYTTKASILLVHNDFQASQTIHATLIRVANVYDSIAFLLEKFGEAANPEHTGISTKAEVHTNATLPRNISIGAYTVVEAGAQIGEGSNIYPQVYVGKRVRLGKNVTLHPGVRIYHDCIIGDNCILHANVVIGADGFGFIPQSDGSFKKVAQIGNVIIENDVEIGANTTIDRATMGSTLIKRGAKLDNLIMVAHNVEIGENTVIAAQAGIAGSSKIGNNCMIGGQAGIVGHLKIADHTKIQAQSGVTKSIKKTHQAIYGTPALPYSNYLKSYAVFKNLTDLQQRVKDLEKS